MNSFTNKPYYESNCCNLLKFIFCFILLFDFYYVLAQNKTITKTTKNENLIKEYAYSNGNYVIYFDASNIKQFWIDKTVVASNENIKISLSNGQSIPFNVQLVNVLETQSCKIEVLSEEKDLRFLAKNSKQETIGKSFPGDDFLNYSISSLSFPLEETDDFSFNIIFSSSNNTNSIAIKAIILSFSDNKDTAYLGSPGFLSLESEIDLNGISLSNTDPQFSSIKYLVSEKYNKIFIRIPNQIASSNLYFYHVVPSNPDDLLPDRVKNRFNNYDFSPKTKFLFIPKPYSVSKEFSIIQRDLPKYKFKTLRIGQYDSTRQLWSLEL